MTLIFFTLFCSEFGRGAVKIALIMVKPSEAMLKYHLFLEDGFREP